MRQAAVRSPAGITVLTSKELSERVALACAALRTTTRTLVTVSTVTVVTLCHIISIMGRRVLQRATLIAKDTVLVRVTVRAMRKRGQRTKASQRALLLAHVP